MTRTRDAFDGEPHCAMDRLTPPEIGSLTAEALILLGQDDLESPESGAAGFDAVGRFVYMLKRCRAAKGEVRWRQVRRALRTVEYEFPT